MKTVLITGASSGIGLSLAHRFSQADYKVYVLGRSEQRLKAAQADLKGPAEILVCDLADSAQLSSTLERLKKDQDFTNNLKVLVNNAGEFQRKSLTDISSEDLLCQYRLQVEVPTLLAKFCVPYLGRHSSTGAIVNISSTLGIKPVGQTAHYSAAKAAMINLTQSLAIELAPKIRVNCVCPGVVDTAIHSGADQAARKFMDELHLLGRMGRPEEVAETAYFLASDFSQWTTGSVVTVDGGISLK